MAEGMTTGALTTGAGETGGMLGFRDHSRQLVLTKLPKDERETQELPLEPDARRIC
jgi:hypothetical protein